MASATRRFTPAGRNSADRKLETQHGRLSCATFTQSRTSATHFTPFRMQTGMSRLCWDWRASKVWLASRIDRICGLPHGRRPNSATMRGNEVSICTDRRGSRLPRGPSAADRTAVIRPQRRKQISYREISLFYRRLGMGRGVHELVILPGWPSERRRKLLKGRVEQVGRSPRTPLRLERGSQCDADADQIYDQNYCN